MNIVRRTLHRLLEGGTKATKLSLCVSIVLLFVIVIFVLFADFIAPYNPYQMNPEILGPPNSKYLFGTDLMGRDIFSRVICGTKFSILIALAAVLQAGSIGATLGLISGYVNGKTDRFLLMIMDTLYSFPSFILALLLVTVLGQISFFSMSAAVAVAAVPTYFRVVRSVTLSLKERTLIEVERSLGAGNLYTIFWHILPRCLPEIITLASLGLADSIVTVAGLGFLGLGVQPPTPEWGADLSYGRRVLTIGVWWPSIFPGLMICMAVFAFNLLGEASTEILTPKLKKG